MASWNGLYTLGPGSITAAMTMAITMPTVNATIKAMTRIL